MWFVLVGGVVDDVVCVLMIVYIWYDMLILFGFVLIVVDVVDLVMVLD